MKKILTIILFAIVFALTSCTITTTNDGTKTNASNAGDQTNDSSITKTEKNNATTTKDSIKDGVLPLENEDSIAQAVGSYSQKFSITTYDGTYNFDVSFDSAMNSGVAKINDEEYYFKKGRGNEYVAYYENDYGYGYERIYNVYLEYMNLLADISHIVLEDAPYASKEEVTYAGREAVNYYITNSKYIIPCDTKLNIILDKKTGAVLSLTYDYLNFYESTSFVDNDEEAVKYLTEYRKNVAFEFFNKDALSLVSIDGFEFPDWYEWTATLQYIDGMEHKTENIASYSCQYMELLDDTDIIKTLAKSIYEKGVKSDYYGYVVDFESLMNERRVSYGYEVIDTINFNAYVTIDGKCYNVVLSGTHNTSNSNEWFVSLIISRSDLY